MALFPGALPAAGSASAASTLAAAGHTSLHNTGADESRAIATKIGTGSSTPTSTTVLTGTGAGTSSWAQVNLTTMVTSTLPVANGGTGVTTSTGSGSVVLGTAPTLSNPTITGGGSWAGSPTISTPTIADFTNATHDHTNNAGGGTLNGANALQDSTVTSEKLDATILVRAYRNAAVSYSTEADIVFDTENWDVGSNFSTSTGIFTAPKTGYYRTYCQVRITDLGDGETGNLRLYGNGVLTTLSTVVGASAGGDPTVEAGDTISLTAGQEIKATMNISTSKALAVGTSTVFITIEFVGA